MKVRCKCRGCHDSRKIRAVAASLDRRSAALVNTLHERLAHAEMDAAYWRAKFEGTWPSDIPVTPAILVSRDARDWSPGGTE